MNKIEQNKYAQPERPRKKNTHTHKINENDESERTGSRETSGGREKRARMEGAKKTIIE